MSSQDVIEGRHAQTLDAQERAIREKQGGRSTPRHMPLRS
jgi:hypothetical protein